MAFAPMQPGTLLNQRYEILAVVGQGGMGTVYKAEHVRLHSIVAVKEIRGTGAEGVEKRQELEACEHEAQFLVRLNHTHLPKVTDAFIENDNFYLIMEFIEGVTLDSRLAAAGGAPVDVLQGVEWGLQIADVLAYLHSQEPPIIFRDLKPSNVMVQPDGAIKLIDFGIARHFQEGASKDTSLLGSVGYSPPEQFGKGQTDQRSDVYAFGATLHHLITGRDPALTPFKFAPANKLNLQVPDSLANLLEMCLSIEPKDRPQSINVAAVQLLRAREELVQRRAQAAAQQAALNAVGRSLADSMEHAPSGRIAGAAHSEVSGTSQRRDSANGERSQANQETGKPAIKVTTASTAKAKTAKTATAKTGNANTMRQAAGAVLLFVLLAGSGAAVVYARHANANKVTTLTPIVAPSVTVNPVSPDPNTPDTVSNPNPTPTPTPTPDAPTTSGPAVAPNTPIQPPPNDNVSLQTALMAPANDMLPIVVSGTVKGQMGASIQLGVYFFDAKGMPINATDANPMYINAQHYLCAYKTLTVNDAEYPVLETLSIPTHLLASVTQPGPLTYQAILFMNNKPIGETPRAPLPAASYSSASAVPPPPLNKPVSHGVGMSEGGR